MLVLAAMAGALATAPSRADPIEHLGLRFSDELGGFELVSVTGRGSMDDPIVVVERITGRGEAILRIDGLDTGFGNPSRSNHFTGFAMVKIVINATDQPWRAFHIELQEELGQTSTYGDGLSFGQERDDTRNVTSIGLPRVRVTDEPHDALDFSGGTIEPGQAVEFHLLVTDNSPQSPFFVLQRQESPVSNIGRFAEWPTTH